MGFSITACVIAGIMFICYCVTLQELSHITHCKADDFWWSLDTYCYSRSERKNASFGLKVGSCQLTFSVVVFFVALASSIYCCKALCCGVPPLGSVSNILWFSFDFLYGIICYFAQCKGIQGSLGFWIPRLACRVTGIRSQSLSGEVGFCIPDSWWDSGFLELYFGFQSPGFGIP